MTSCNVEGVAHNDETVDDYHDVITVPPRRAFSIFQLVVLILQQSGGVASGGCFCAKSSDKPAWATDSLCPPGIKMWSWILTCYLNKKTTHVNARCKNKKWLELPDHALSRCKRNLYSTSAPVRNITLIQKKGQFKYKSILCHESPPKKCVIQSITLVRSEWYKVRNECFHDSVYWTH